MADDPKSSEAGKVEFAKNNLEYDLDFRAWYSSDQKFSVVAKFERFLNDKVRLRRKDTDRLIDIEIRILSPDDQALLQKIKKQLIANKASKKSDERLNLLRQGIEAYCIATMDFQAALAEIGKGNFTSAVHDRQISEANRKFRSSLQGKLISWHIVIEDIEDNSIFGSNPIRRVIVNRERKSKNDSTKISISGSDLFGNDVVQSIFPRSPLVATLNDSEWMEFRKGDILRITGEFGARNTTFYLCRPRNMYRMPIEIKSIDRIEPVSGETVESTKSWISGIGM